MKLFLPVLMVLLCDYMVNNSANAETNPSVTPTVRKHQAQSLITEPITINSYWYRIDKANNQSSLSISDPECKKVNPINYINNLGSFFQCYDDANNSKRPTYEPVEYLKVPPLDSGIKIKLGNF